MKKIATLLCALTICVGTAVAQTTIASWDFSASSMSGIVYGASAVVGPNDYIDGAGVPQSVTGAHWTRIDDTAYVFGDDFGFSYPRMASYAWTRRIANNMSPDNTGNDNGFMFISLMDGPEGYSHGTGFINAYVAFPPVARPSTTQVVAVEWDQFYYKFYDRCYIDYKVNGTWNTTEVNVEGIDVNINTMATSHCEYILPLSLATQSNLEMRLRIYSEHRSNAWGYCWAVDNFTIIESPASNWTTRDELYIDGAYGMIPQGMQIPLTWYSSVRNTGAVAQTGIRVGLRHTSPNGTVSTPINVPQANINPGVDYEQVYINGRGFFNSEEPDRYFDVPSYGWPGLTTTNAGLPTAEAGLNRIQAVLSSNDTLLTRNFDAHTYTVTTADSNGIYRWGYGNGVLAGGIPGYHFAFTEDGNYVGDDGAYNLPGYALHAAFTTPNTMPTDSTGNPWVLRGVELVADPTINAVGAGIRPVLYEVSKTDGLSYIPVMTGVEGYVHTVTADEVNTLATGYLMPGSYNTVRIMFPEQPTLKPNTTYMLGYKLESGDFAVAISSDRYVSAVTETPTDPIYDYTNYADDSVLSAYAADFTLGDYNILVRSASNQINASIITGKVPMINALVGPHVSLPTLNVIAYCDSSTAINDFGGTNLCCNITAYAEGSYDIINIVPNNGCVIDSIIIDGMNVPLVGETLDASDCTIYLTDYRTGEMYDYYPRMSYSYTFNNLSTGHIVQSVGSPITGPYTLAINNPNGVTVETWTPIYPNPVAYYGSRAYYSDTVFIRFTTANEVDHYYLTVDGSTIMLTPDNDGYFLYTMVMGGSDHTISIMDVILVEHTITAINVGGGYMRNPNADSFITDTATLVGYDGDSLTIQLLSIQPSRASVFGLDTTNCWLHHLYVDGVELSLTQSSSMLAIADHSADFGYIYYTLVLPYDTNHTVVAQFGSLIETYTVNVLSSDSTLGTVSGGGTYYENTQAELTAMLQPGATFSGWSNGATTNPMLITVTSDTTITAFFTAIGEVHDTLTVYDTVDNYIHDTLTILDTMWLTQYDTVDNYIHDTLTIFDTMWLTQYDTVDNYIYDTLTILDTMWLTQYDTVDNYIHDTLTILDTMWLTHYDTIDHYIHDTLTLVDTMWLTHYDTIWLYDTIIIHDTIYIPSDGIDGTEAMNIKVYSADGHVVVEGVDGNRVALYDINGRLLATRRDEYAPLRFEVPVSGTYMIKVGRLAARKVVVIR